MRSVMKWTPVALLFLATLVGSSRLVRADEPVEDLYLGGGTGTVFINAGRAFSLPFNALQNLERLKFQSGDALFTDNWVTAPASATGRDGLGPLFIARACSSCHLNDGRGTAPDADQEALGLLLRLTSASPHNYGDQIQNQAILGVSAEASLKIDWSYQTITLPDGQTVELRSPIPKLSKFAYGPLPQDTQMSLRLAPPMIGLGLLEVLSEETILSAADPDDLDGDGISGRPNYVYDHESAKNLLGRFGWKANQPNLRQQVAGAFAGDMGLTSTLFPDLNCPQGDNPCRNAPDGGSPEVTEKQLNLVVLYSQFLAVPSRRDTNLPEVVQGRELFFANQCQSCHRPTFTTAADTHHPLLANQKIWPYSDLLLHDMGQGLADHRPDGLANGMEWRTAPLWGLGMAGVINGHQVYLHDGRARTIEEAILWHDGEARASRESYKNLSADERKNLIRFLQSL